MSPKHELYVQVRPTSLAAESSSPFTSAGKSVGVAGEKKSHTVTVTSIFFNHNQEILTTGSALTNFLI